MAFDKVLIANRGEIAVRVINGCRKLGYKTVAVHSEADRQALHVRRADEAACIGPAPAGESYLSIDNLLHAARATGAGAIHPGYGFLSEREDFAHAVQEAGLVFIGPDPDSIAAMGNKSASKIRMIAAGVPCVPGYQGDDQSDETLVNEAIKAGLPVMVKAAAGGGGRGMRLVHREEDLLAAVQSARSEARNSFGDGQLLVEKAVLDARHVEIQVFGDRHGNVVHLGERDCSVQRRNQKVVEEAPSPAVDAALRERMGAAAVAAAKAVNYVGAGTVEFMLAADGAFYFLEMNTRLQVEHPVTELVYDVDLVEWQLRIARGEPLPMTQAQIDACRRGWAIEVRLCTEEPARNFMPQTGKLLAWRPPSGPGMRVDHGLVEGGEISPFYDSMQAKLIARGDTREQARQTLLEMLDQTLLLGVGSNRDFLRRIVAHPVFAGGDFSTGFIARHFPASAISAARQPENLHVALAAVLFHYTAAQRLAASAGLDAELLDWQSSRAADESILLKTDDASFNVRLRPLSGARYEVEVAQQTFVLELVSVDVPELVFALDGVARRARFAHAGETTLWFSLDGLTLQYTDATFAPPAKGAAGSDGRLTAPMDGKIIAVETAPGATIGKGQALAVLEAMKMEFVISSAVDGVVESVECQPGQQVKARQLLIRLAPASG
ncbi:MAG: biotin carboxylase N-terminal domain-containing protein [Pseudoxanthomonas sp.]